MRQAIGSVRTPEGKWKTEWKDMGPSTTRPTPSSSSIRRMGQMFEGPADRDYEIDD